MTIQEAGGSAHEDLAGPQQAAAAALLDVAVEALPGYARTVTLPALPMVLLTVVVLALWQRSTLRGRHEVPAVPRPEDRALSTVTALACLALVPLLLAGVAVPWTTFAATVPLLP